MMQGSIYLIRCQLGLYVGQTFQLPYSRWQGHYSLLKRNEHTNPHLQNAWNKYGEEAFEFKIAEQHEKISPDKLTEAEQFWIDAYRVAGVKVYNIAIPGPAPMLGRKHSAETKLEMSIRMMGHKRNLGCKHTDDRRQAQSQSLMGHKISEKTRAKISRAHKGKKLSEEHRSKISQALIGKRRKAK